MEVSLSLERQSRRTRSSRGIGKHGTAVIVDTIGERDAESDYLSQFTEQNNSLLAVSAAAEEMNESRDDKDSTTYNKDSTTTTNKKKKKKNKKDRNTVTKIKVETTSDAKKLWTPKQAVRKPASTKKVVSSPSSSQVKVTELSPTKNKPRNKIKVPRTENSECSGESDVVQVLKSTKEVRREERRRVAAALKVAKENPYSVESICIDTAKELLEARTTVKVFEPLKRKHGNRRKNQQNQPRQELTRISKPELLNWLTFAQHQIEVANFTNQISCNTSLSTKELEVQDFNGDEVDDGFFVSFDEAEHEQTLMEQQRIYEMVEGIIQRQSEERKSRKEIRGPPTPRYRADAPRTPRELREVAEDHASQKLQFLSEVKLWSEEM
mmetsp:Transcript_12350/g.34225  ORF Transcript_12350/g.34225 Transcript_12350/m.34225 type:complete len:381 (+) Transcript_12350:93-1235(+)